MTKEQRHRCMSHIRSKDTRPEVLVRKSLFAAGFRYLLNVKALPGTPDIVLKKYHTIILINGCFWHGHEGCRHFVLPQTNRQFWEEKISRNRRRDTAVLARLEALGWKVITVWECELEPARRTGTLESLPGKIMECSRQHEMEAAQRKRLRAERREEREAEKVRKSLARDEIYNRYEIPKRIMTESEKYDQNI